MRLVAPIIPRNSHVYNPATSSGHVSYASVVKGTTKLENKEVTVDSKVVIKDDGRDNLSFPLALLGCFTYFLPTANTHNRCKGECFLDVQPQYLRGLWVLLNFNSMKARDCF